MEAQEIGFRQDSTEILHHFHPFHGAPLHVRVKSRNTQPQRPAQRAHALPDAPKPHDQRRLARHVRRRPPITPGEIPGSRSPVTRHRILGQRQQHHERVFGHGPHVGVDGDGHRDFPRGQIGHVHIVRPHAVPRHDPQAIGALQRFPRKRGCADHHGVRPGHAAGDVFGGQIRQHFVGHQIRPGFQQFDPLPVKGADAYHLEHVQLPTLYGVISPF